MNPMNIEEILKCPHCPEEDTLSFDEREIGCSRCGSVYPVRDGIYVMYQPGTEDGIELDADQWKEEERKHHDSIVDIYEERIRPKGDTLDFVQRSGFAGKINRFMEDSRGMVLDYGCGPGADTVEFLKNGLPVVAMDISEVMLRVLIGRAEKTDRRGWLTCVVGDGERLPFRSGIFDFVSVCGVLHHIPRTGFALKEISRVLRPGGRMRIQEPNDRSGFLKEISRRIGSLSNVAGPEQGGSVRSPCPERHVDTERERPLSGAEIMDACERLGFEGEIIYWTDFFNMVKRLPKGLAVRVSELLVRIEAASGGGDMFCILATKGRDGVIETDTGGEEFLVEMGKNDDLFHVVNFHGREYDERGIPFRWTGKDSEIVVPSRGRRPKRISLEVDCWRPVDLPPPRVRVILNRRLIFSEVVRGRRKVTVEVSGNLEPADEDIMTIRADTWVPLSVDRRFGDGRLLGVKVYSVKVEYR